MKQQQVDVLAGSVYVGRALEARKPSRWCLERNTQNWFWWHSKATVMTGTSVTGCARQDSQALCPGRAFVGSIKCLPPSIVLLPESWICSCLPPGLASVFVLEMTNRESFLLCEPLSREQQRTAKKCSLLFYLCIKKKNWLQYYRAKLWIMVLCSVIKYPQPREHHNTQGTVMSK